MNTYLRWYQRAVWFGIAANLAFCLTAWFAPERILKGMGLRQTANNVWLRNVGMLLVNLSLFNAGAAVAPLQYPANAWFVAVCRIIAASFFFQVSLTNLRGSTERPKSFLALLIFDFSMGIICGGLLYKGLPPNTRFALARREA